MQKKLKQANAQPPILLTACVICFQILLAMQDLQILKGLVQTLLISI
jgi:hypothetical protein